MSDTRLHVDGAPRDGVGHDFASPEHLQRYREASDALSKFKVPVLAHAYNPHEKLFIAAFDGTGNNKFRDPAHATNVAKIDDDVLSRNRFGAAQVYSHYVVGPGTQDRWLTSASDTLFGHSYRSNIEEAYDALVQQANRWAVEDPQTVVRVQSIGFSRGGSQVPGFARLVHERGIPSLESGVIGDDGIERYQRYIAAPGRVVQAVGIFDSVATGAPMNFDRRLPSSVVSGFQITAADELRKSFPSDQLLPPGLSEDGRFLNIMVPGAHSDIGGGYLRDGLSIRCGNLMRDYCNALRDVPFLEKEYEPADQRLNVIHRSTEGQVVFRVDPRIGVRGQPSGTNTVLTARGLEYAGDAPHGPEALNERLERGLVRRPVPIGPANHIPNRDPFPPAPLDKLEAAGRSAPFAPNVIRGLGVIATGIDVGRSTLTMSENLHAGNATGAMSEFRHLAGRNVGGWVGAETFMAVGAAAGVSSGPGFLVTGAVGGIVGAVGGGKIADEYDQYRITHQTDIQGNTWRLEEQQQAWVRDIPPLPGSPHGQRIVADPTLADRLTFQAASTAVELGLVKDRTPPDPFTQPSAPGDTPSLREAPWTHNSVSHQWTRVVTDQHLEHGLTRSHSEVASPQKASELDRMAAETVQKGVDDSRLAIAERYRQTYDQMGWERHGALPEAVDHALKRPEGHIVASDGNEYSRGDDGQWATPGMLFGTNVAGAGEREELNMAEGPTRAILHGGPPAIHEPAVAAPVIPARLDDPGHPDHEFFKQVRGHVVELDKGLGRSPDQYTDNIASALTVQARADGMKRVDAIELSDDRSNLWAVEIPPGLNGYLFEIATKVPTAEADTPMEQSGARWPEAMQQFQGHEQERVESQQRAQERSQAEAQSNSMRGPSMSM